MGYAQISGIPAVYGLYGSVLPILLFALFSTSRQFIFGVDAAPAAIVGGALSTLGIAAESEAAMDYVPAIALFAGLWLFIFFLLHADKIVDFISTPVMGGFISGIAVTIILMQIPKLMGSPAGSGELLELAEHIFAAAKNISWLSLFMGLGALVLIRTFKKLAPKFPMAIVIMALGVLSTIIFHVDEKGVVLLQSATVVRHRLQEDYAFFVYMKNNGGKNTQSHNNDSHGNFWCQLFKCADQHQSTKPHEEGKPADIFGSSKDMLCQFQELSGSCRTSR